MLLYRSTIVVGGMAQRSDDEQDGEISSEDENVHPSNVIIEATPVNRQDGGEASTEDFFLYRRRERRQKRDKRDSIYEYYL